MRQAVELDLPLGDRSSPPAELAGAERLGHLAAVPGLDPDTAMTLLRAFPSLAAVYAAELDELAAVVGSVAAARVRWFLDAPVTEAALPGRRRPGVGARGWRGHAA